jgi:hypothetical protein
MKNLAERGGFEPPIALRLCLISSQVHSTGLCHLSVHELAFCVVCSEWLRLLLNGLEVLVAVLVPLLFPA